MVSNISQSAVKNITIGGNLRSEVVTPVDDIIASVADTIENGFNKLKESGIDDDIKQLLEHLLKAITEVNKQVPQNKNKIDYAETMARDAEALINEATSSKPRQRWYEVSIEGLKQAAIYIGEVADPVLVIVKKLHPLLLAAAQKK